MLLTLVGLYVVGKDQTKDKKRITVKLVNYTRCLSSQVAVFLLSHTNCLLNQGIKVAVVAVHLLLTSSQLLNAPCIPFVVPHS